MCPPFPGAPPLSRSTLILATCPPPIVPVLHVALTHVPYPAPHPPRPPRRSSIELQRIESVTRSPVYANFSETMAGLDTIRAYRMQDRWGNGG